MKPTIEVTISPKLLGFLQAIARLEGFGDTTEEVAARFMWDGVNRLLEQRRISALSAEIGPPEIREHGR